MECRLSHSLFIHVDVTRPGGLTIILVLSDNFLNFSTVNEDQEKKITKKTKRTSGETHSKKGD